MTESEYRRTRYTYDHRRVAVWQHITRDLAQWIPPTADVLELGAGYCDFSNNVVASSRTALDIDPSFKQHAAEGVRCVVGDCADLTGFDAASFDVVFASNLLEHLDRDALRELLAHLRRVLRPGGRFVAIQPNFRLQPKHYFDDYTHVTVFTDRSLPDFLESEGLAVEHVAARYLPLTMKSRLAGAHRLVPLYLRSPVKPLAGQMLVVARKPA